MLWHCGVLDDALTNGDDRREVFRRYNWHALPKDLRHELLAWLGLPGFSTSFHAWHFNKPRRLIQEFQKAGAKLQDSVFENWVSVTPADCIRLAHRRPPKGDLPLLSKVQMLRDHYRNSPLKDIAERYGVVPSTVFKILYNMTLSLTPESEYGRELSREFTAVPDEVFAWLLEDDEIAFWKKPRAPQFNPGVRKSRRIPSAIPSVLTPPRLPSADTLVKLTEEEALKMFDAAIPYLREAGVL